jgi:hypothetical protein
MRRLVLLLSFAASLAHAQPFALDDIVIVHDAQPTMRLADCPRRCVVVGTADAPLVRDAARALDADLRPLAGQSERYLRVAVRALDPGVVLDRIDVVPDGAPDYYGMPPLD